MSSLIYSINHFWTAQDMNSIESELCGIPGIANLPGCYRSVRNAHHNVIGKSC